MFILISYYAYVPKGALASLQVYLRYMIDAHIQKGAFFKNRCTSFIEDSLFICMHIISLIEEILVSTKISLQNML
jgi:hypothetical protein